MDLMLDTNIVLTLLRENDTSRKVQRHFGFFAPNTEMIISVVTVGELKSLALQNNWGARRIAKMQIALRDYVIVNVGQPRILDAYAKIDAFSQGKPKPENPKFSSRNMGKNDLWIAATTYVYNLHLFTTNGDFDHLAEDFLDLTKVDLAEFA